MNDLEYTKSIETIWKKYQAQEIVLAKNQPLCYTGIPKEGLIIIGLNPSVARNDKVFESQVSPSPIQVPNEIIKEYQKDANGKQIKHSYHDALIRFVEDARGFSSNPNFDWGHLDVFCFRITSSRVVKDRRRKEEDQSFYHDQIQLTKKLVLSKKPKVILVANAYSSDIIKYHWMEEEKEFDHEIGTYRMNGIPIFFSRMLSGPSPLDKGTRERLAWQVGRIL